MRFENVFYLAVAALAAAAPVEQTKNVVDPHNRLWKDSEDSVNVVDPHNRLW